MNSIYLYNVNANAAGFQAVCKMLSDPQKDQAEKIMLCMRGSFFNASMSAALYAVLKRIQEGHKVYLHEARSARVENILLKNGFFPHLIGAPEVHDTYGTTIRFRVFQNKDEEFFYNYTDRYIIHHHYFPAASEALKRKIHEGLLELFANALMHAQSHHGIITCGQFFPNKNTLEFCLADAGIGVHDNVRRFESGISDEEAIIWAMGEGHTTRTRSDGVPGGLGLKMLEDFIRLNNGKLIMASGHGYVEVNASRVTSRTLEYPFPGTVAHIIIQTDDPCYYTLSDENADEELPF
jgi:hypothetical protein